MVLLSLVQAKKSISNAKQPPLAATLLLTKVNAKRCAIVRSSFIKSNAIVCEGRWLAPIDAA